MGCNHWIVVCLPIWIFSGGIQAAEAPVPSAQPNSTIPGQSPSVPAVAPKPSAEPTTSSPTNPPDPFWAWVPPFAVHAQSTVIMIQHPSFYHKYDGANSLQSVEGRKTSLTATVFAGMKVWRGGEVYVDPEVAGGQGPSSVLGVAGAINGETPRVATPEPEPYFARVFLRQTFNCGGDLEVVPDTINQLAGTRRSDRIQITIGKLSANDLFDNNTYSHDPRSQFSNWSLWENGAWDYPADTRGYTLGTACEVFLHRWVYRLGVFEVPKTANGPELEGHITRALATVAEIERDYQVADHPGAVRFLAYLNKDQGGNYQTAIDRARATSSRPDITAVRRSGIKYGFGLNWEQELRTDLGIFARLGWNDGHTESWAFTEIDRTASLGAAWQGRIWHRPDDTMAIAGAVNGISKPHRDYLSAGGYGFLLGDGALNYRYEEILEAYYLFKATPLLAITPSLQYVVNPGYNHDRGPAVFYALRGHVDL